MPESAARTVSIPLRLVSHGHSQTAFSSSAEITFEPGSENTIHYQEFVFQAGTLHYHAVKEGFKEASGFIIQKPVPVFSILAVVVLIFFRNLFFGAFQRYFLNFQSNYEIDFSIQKIGVFPIVLAVSVVVLAFSEFYDSSSFLSSSTSTGTAFQFQKLRDGLIFLMKPLGLSMGLFFVLNLTSKLFPLIFSDLKTLFTLSLLVLVWNFSSFGANIHGYISYHNFTTVICAIYFVIRTILLFNVLRLAYRFHLPLTLFYICAFNLGTVLILFDGLSPDIFSLYE